MFGWALTPEGILKVDEIEPRKKRSPPKHQRRISQNDRSRAVSSVTGFLGSALELIGNPRGIGWQFGTGNGLHLGQDWRNTESKNMFVLQSLWGVLLSYLAQDISETFMRIFPPHNGIFVFGKNALQKYAVSTTLHLSYFGFVYPRTSF